MYTLYFAFEMYLALVTKPLKSRKSLFCLLDKILFRNHLLMIQGVLLHSNVTLKDTFVPLQLLYDASV
jgi:hypothetical protein